MNSVRQYVEDVRYTLAALPEQPINEAIDVLLSANYVSSTVFSLGNGGSSATASHLACDLAKGTITPGRPRFRVVALTDNVPLMTAWSNDTAYDQIFSEQLSGLMGRGDVVVAISGSGNSHNVLRAVELARQIGGITIGLSGFDGGRLSRLVDVPIVVPCDCMEQIEDVHMVLCNLMCTVIRQRLRRIEPPVLLMLDPTARERMWQSVPDPALIRVPRIGD